MTVYDRTFYRRQKSGSKRSAEIIVPILQELTPIHSVCDVGCGVGTWLSVFREKGVSDILGIDGGYVDRSLIQIPLANFRDADLSEPLRIDRRFDLVMSLEVAEHLPERSAPGFVESLTRLAPVVLFSAAIPGQGGIGHVNEQWQTWWTSIFSDLGFVLCEVVRPRVWYNSDVEYWYRQNAMVFCEAATLQSNPMFARADHVLRLPLVHPEYLSFRDSLRAVAAAIRRMPVNLGKRISDRGSVAAQ